MASAYLRAARSALDARAGQQGSAYVDAPSCGLRLLQHESVACISMQVSAHQPIAVESLFRVGRRRKTRQTNDKEQDERRRVGIHGLDLRVGNGAADLSRAADRCSSDIITRCVRLDLELHMPGHWPRIEIT